MTAVIILFELTGDYRIILPLMLAVVVSTLIAEAVSDDTIYTLKLRRRGIDLRAGRDVDLMRTIPVAEAMATATPTAPRDLTVAEAGERLAQTRDRALVVVDETGALAGLVTVHDLQQAMLDNKPGATLGEIASHPVLTVFPDDMLSQAIRQSRSWSRPTRSPSCTSTWRPSPKGPMNVHRMPRRGGQRGTANVRDAPCEQHPSGVRGRFAPSPPPRAAPCPTTRGTPGYISLSASGSPSAPCSGWPSAPPAWMALGTGGGALLVLILKRRHPDRRWVRWLLALVAVVRPRGESARWSRTLPKGHAGPSSPAGRALTPRHGPCAAGPGGRRIPPGGFLRLRDVTGSPAAAVAPLLRRDARVALIRSRRSPDDHHAYAALVH
jgi:CBS domain-containing protein